MTEATTDKWITVAEAMKIAKVSDARIYQLRKRKQIASKKIDAKAGRGVSNVRVSRNDVEKYAESRSKPNSKAGKKGGKQKRVVKSAPIQKPEMAKVHVPKPDPTKLVPFGDAYRLPAGTVLLIQKGDGVEMVDSSRALVL